MKELLGDIPSNESGYEMLPADNLASSVDWRSKGAVNAVKNQGHCGSCWAFSATSAIESHHFIKTGKLINLAEQELVDCDTDSHGCNGGNTGRAFGYMMKHSQELTKDYPYTAKNGSCKYKSSKGQVKVTKYSNV